MIEYQNGDLFTAPQNSILVHACNAKGVWGSGIAKEFKKRFPIAFEQYKQYCKTTEIKIVVGSCKLIFDESNYIGCLITSNGYGKFVDTPEQILKSTAKAFEHLLSQIDESIEIHMPLINSGLFAVPWKSTEEILNTILQTRKCTVWINT